MSEPITDSGAEPYMEALNELFAGLTEFVEGLKKQADGPADASATDDEKRTAFMAEHAELISRATTLVVIAPGIDGAPPECKTLALPGVCGYVQALMLRGLADRFIRTHPPRSCK